MPIDTVSEAAMAPVQGRPAMMPNFDKDFEAGRRLLSDNGLPVFEAPIHLEGGSIHSDGQGTMVVTEECLLDPSRNPDLGREGIEQVRGVPRAICTYSSCAVFLCIQCLRASTNSLSKDWFGNPARAWICTKREHAV